MLRPSQSFLFEFPYKVWWQ